MNIDRKQFLMLIAAAAAGARTAAAPASPAASPPGEGARGNAGRGSRLVDAGPAADYGADGVYARFRLQGFFVIRRGGRLFALASVCTHRKCKISPESDRTFSCDCHGSTFDADGKVTEGPATKDLPILPSFTNEAGRLIVKVPAG